MALFENYERRVDKINSVLAQIRHFLHRGVQRDHSCRKGIDCDKIVRWYPAHLL